MAFGAHQSKSGNTMPRAARSMVGALGSLSLAAASLAVSIGLVLSEPALARETRTAVTEVSLTTLPVEAQRTHQLIRAGGPFPYEKDGTVFGNRERLLPREKRGYYREYTVPTPGASNRGARRIVCGGQQPRLPDACFYTGDHYASFQRIAP